MTTTAKKKTLAKRATLAHVSSGSVFRGLSLPGHLRAYKRFTLPVGLAVILGGFAFLEKGVGFTGVRAPECPLAAQQR